MRVLLGLVASTPKAATRVASGAKPPTAAAFPDPTVEIIRGDKRAHEVVRQEQQ